MTNARAVRYRRLALAEVDQAKSDLLNKLAGEADQGILCTAEWISARSLKLKRDEPAKAQAR
jgi:hypothetical protein